MLRQKLKRPAKKPERPEYYREVFTVMHCLRGLPATELAKYTYLAPSTISKIRKGPAHGGTRFPRADTLEELFRLAGYETKRVQIGDPLTVAPTRKTDAAIQQLKKSLSKSIKGAKVPLLTAAKLAAAKAA